MDIEGHKRLWKVLKGHGKSFPDTRFAFQWWPVGLECQAKYQSLTSFFGLGVGTWDLDLGLTKNLFFVSGVRHFYHYKYQVFLDKIIFLPELRAEHVSGDHYYHGYPGQGGSVTF